MQLAIIGFPSSGKSTVFHALTGGRSETSSRGKAALGVVKVTDQRLVPLVAMFRPKKVTHAEITYLDVHPAAGFGSGKGIEGQLLNDLTQMDALVHVVGLYQDGSQLPSEVVRNQLDTENMEMELAFSDLAVLERRLQRLDTSKTAARSQDREQAFREAALLGRLKDGLEAGIPISEQEVSAEELLVMRNFQFLTGKPLVVVLNVAEEQLPLTTSLERDRSSGGRSAVIAICGRLEEELAGMGETDAQEFMADAGIIESSLNRMVAISYQALGLISFFTVGPDEVRSWSIPRGTAAPQAAGKIHSDMERGFIRADVVGYDDFLAAGSMAEARKRGVRRSEGKTYTVRDGDIINFLFNV